MQLFQTILLFTCSVLFSQSAFSCYYAGNNIGGLESQQLVQDLNEIASKVEDDTYGEFFSHPLLTYIATVRTSTPNVFKDIDIKLSGLTDTKYDMRVDLVMADTLDQLSLLLEKKKWKKYRKEIYSLLGDKPLENFPELIVKLEKISKQDPKFLKALNKIHWQEYNSLGQATITKLKISRKGRFNRFKRNPKINRFNIIAHDPEAENILRTIGSSRVPPFISNRPTVTKLDKMKRSAIKKIKKENERAYTRLLATANKKDELRYGKITDLKIQKTRRGFLGLFKKNRAKGKAFKTSKDVKNSTLLLFNKIDTHPQKAQMLGYINSHVKKSKRLHLMADHKGQKHLIMTPTYLHHNRVEVEKLIKEFSYDNMINSGDDEVIYQYRKWIKKNRKKIVGSGIKLSNKKGMPTRADALDNYEKLVETFPSRPWEGKMVMKTSARGAVVAYLDDGDIKRGALEGAIYGVGETAVKIYTLGYKYTPHDLITQEDIDHYYAEHNSTLSEHAYDGDIVKMDKKTFDGITFRKNGMIGIPGGGVEVFGNARMHALKEFDKHTLLHESTHYAQELHYGALNFAFKALGASFKGKHFNKYEDYAHIYH